MMKLRSVNFYFCLFVLAASSFSCKTEKNYTYFQTRPDNSLLQTLISKDFEHKIQPDDILTILISSADAANSLKFNTSPNGYLVDKRGNITLYKLGEVNIQGFTIYELKEKLSKLLEPYLKDLVLDISFKNHRIVVMGEVASPGVIPMTTEHISILEALASRGDLRETAKRDRILVIRQTQTGKIFNRMNLLDESIFNSPFFYLQSDDIVYVEPDPEKKNPKNTAQVIGYVLSAASLFFLILDRITR